MRVSGDLTSMANRAFVEPAPKKPARKGKRREGSPVAIRLTQDERERLEVLAAGMTLSAYVRACLFGQDAKRRKRRPKDAVADKQAIADTTGARRCSSHSHRPRCNRHLLVMSPDPSALTYKDLPL